MLARREEEEGGICGKVITAKKSITFPIPIKRRYKDLC